MSILMFILVTTPMTMLMTTPMTMLMTAIMTTLETTTYAEDGADEVVGRGCWLELCAGVMCQLEVLDRRIGAHCGRRFTRSSSILTERKR